MENVSSSFANYETARNNQDNFNLLQELGNIGAGIVSYPANVLGIDLGQKKLFSSDKAYEAIKGIQQGVASVGAAGTPLSQIINRTRPVPSPPIPVTLPIATNDTLIADNHNMVLIVAGVILFIILISS